MSLNFSSVSLEHGYLVFICCCLPQVIEICYDRETHCPLFQSNGETSARKDFLQSIPDAQLYMNSFSAFTSPLILSDQSTCLNPENRFSAPDHQPQWVSPRRLASSRRQVHRTTTYTTPSTNTNSSNETTGQTRHQPARQPREAAPERQERREEARR
jgi:hypothetical protein